MILTYKYRLKDRCARKVLRQHAIACNQVWNYCVDVQRETERKWRSGRSHAPWLSRFELVRLTKGVSAELHIHAQTVQEICRRFVESRDKKKGTPRLRASFGPRAARGFVPFQKQSRQISGNCITYLGKKYRFFGSKKRPISIASASGGAFVEDSVGRWWAVIHVNSTEASNAQNGTIGIDLGLETIATMSDGTRIERVRHFASHERKLATAQRARNKRQTKVIHAKIANSRRDQNHKSTSKIVRENSFIAVGDVSSVKLTKTRMAKSVSDVGWAQFKSMLLYKARLRRAEVKIVNESFSTQACSDCGAIGGPKGIAGLRIRDWECPHCGAVHDRDVNAAKNILNFALSAQRRGDESRRAA